MLCVSFYHQIQVIDNRHVLIGRSSGNDITINIAQVSRYHAVARLVGEQAVVMDRDSTNGTYLNGERLEPGREYLIQDNDTIRLGDGVNVYVRTSHPELVQKL